MPSFNSGNVNIEITPSGSVRVVPVQGGPVVEYKDLTDILMERPPWLNQVILPVLAASNPVPVADSERFLGGRPHGMSPHDYRRLERNFQRHHVVNEESQAMLIRGAALTTTRQMSSGGGMMLALPAAIAAVAGPQFALLVPSAVGMPVLKQTFDTMTEALESVPAPMRNEIERNFAPLQAQFATSLGVNDPPIAGMDRWTAIRNTGRPGQQPQTMFDGRYIGSDPLQKGLFLHQFELAASGQNGMATVARIIGEHIDPSLHSVSGARSTIALSPSGATLLDGKLLSAIEANAVRYVDAAKTQHQRTLAIENTSGLSL
jgi:hypothetical protein